MDLVTGKYDGNIFDNNTDSKQIVDKVSKYLFLSV